MGQEFGDGLTRQNIAYPIEWQYFAIRPESMFQFNRLAGRLFVASACVFAVETQAKTPPLADPASTALSMSPEQVREDFELAIAAVEAGLPEIHTFVTSTSWDLAKRRARQALPAITDADALYRVLRPLLSRIGEGHLVLHRSEAMRAHERQARGLLPIDVHWTESSATITQGHGDASRIPAGSRLLTIDGEPPSTLIAEMMSAFGHDGEIRTGAMREGEGLGYARARFWLRGPQARFRVKWQAPAGEVRVEEFAGVAYADHAETRVASPEPSPLARLQWLDARTALLTVPTLSNRRYRAVGADYRATIQSAFDELHARGADRLILDLRENGGGSESNENWLFSFLVAQPIRKYASVRARGARLSVRDLGGREHAVDVFDLEEWREQLLLPGGELLRRNQAPEGLMSHWVPSSPVFEGRVVVLAGGNTFSGAAELASMLYHTRRAIFVGEEVGGAHAGNTSGYTWDVTLPNSGMPLEVPLLRFRFAWRELPIGRGVPPHCAVAPEPPGSPHDQALAVARALFEQAWSPGSTPLCPRVIEPR